MANSGRKGIVRFEDALAYTSIGTGLVGLDGGTNSTNTSYGLAWTQSLDTGNTSYTISQSATKGQHIAGSLDATDNDMIEFCGSKIMFYGQQGFNAVEALVQFDAVATMAFNFGFTDEVTCASATLPVEMGTVTQFATGCTTFCGLVYDTDATNANVHCAWVDDAVVATEPLGNLRMKGVAPVADKWIYMRVEMQDQGSGNPVRATFQYNQDGVNAIKEFETTVDRDQGLAYYFGVENRDGLARGIYIKLPAWEQSISD